MDLNRLFNMVFRMVFRSAVDAGIKYAASKGKPEAEMTPEERVEAKRARDLAQKAQQAARVTRRFWR
jgi:hypothetical protein